MTIAHMTPSIEPAASDYATLIGLSQSVLDAMPAAVYVCSADGAIMRFNRRAVEIWGRPPAPGDADERFCGAFRLYHLDGRAPRPAESPMATVLRTGRPLKDAELAIERADGSRAIALANIEPLLDEQGRLEGAISCLQDITGRRSDERTLQESEYRSREVLQALPMAVYTTDAEGRITFFNEAAAAFWGRRPALGESLWCGSWRLFRSDGSPMAHDACPMAVALKEDRSIRNVEAIAERPDGVRIPFMPYPTPLHDAAGRLTGAVNMLVDVSFHKDAALSQKQLINELNHRVKNALASVQSIVAQTLRRSGDVASARHAVDQRLVALARAHDLLTAQSWRGASLRALVQGALVSHCPDATRLDIEGPDIQLAPKMTLSLAMAMHELGANAVKFGALSTDLGRIGVAWTRLDGPDGPRLVLDWRESGGPPVVAPARGGFGVRLIESGLAGESGGIASLDFPESGARCHIDLPLPPTA